MTQFNTRLYTTRCIVLVLFAVFLGIENAAAGSLPSSRISDIRNTKHNLSANPSDVNRNVQASDNREICVFCHTPHAANPNQGPLWNRQLSSATYDTYNSGSLDATGEGVALDQPNGISKLCLSCHDGTIAIGSVRVLNGAWATGAIAMNGTNSDGTMPDGSVGAASGYTRRLGTDLTNDHPISFTYDTALAQRDGELRDPANEPHIGNRSPGNAPHVPLENDQVQCNSCHDPHIRDAGDPTKSIKFLRLNRFQKVSPSTNTFNETNDIICLACHEKAGWVGSAHATAEVANETYTSSAANLREFPAATEVWESACLACHDTHTVSGSRRLLREGTDGPTGAGGAKIGGSAAIEETCFACHSSDGGTLTSQGMNTEVPDIKTDFELPFHMPIRNSEQLAGYEVHDIGTVGSDLQEPDQRGKDFIESQAMLGKGNPNNRHVECTDCHNPHRVVRRRLFNESNVGGVMDAAGTHDHWNTPHTNIASGVLRGAWGVEPVYASNDFNTGPTSFTVKRGDPGNSGSTAVSSPYMTREYQVCLKCHSSYAYDTPPMLGLSSVTTPRGVNHMDQYTDQAREYNSPDSHKGEFGSGGGGMGGGMGGGCSGGGLGADGGADPAFNDCNHRSWHPVMNDTGRTPSVRNASANTWTAPFNAAVGTQTMYCTDCHGSNTPPGTVDPDGQSNENGAVWGPHGSTNYFLLKGDWSGNVPGSPENDFTNRPGTGDDDSGTDTSDHLCFKCHEYEQYAATTGSTQASGFSGMGCMCLGGMGGMGGGNFHRAHEAITTNFRCNLCHVAVPHGWKNKNFLVNLNDVGPEGGLPPGTQVRNNTTSGYVNGPYYNRAVNKIVSFARSGSWRANNCGSVGSPGNGRVGVGWMNGGMGGMGGMGGGGGSSEACNNVP